MDGAQTLEMEMERHVQFERAVYKRSRPTFGAYGIECDENGKPRDVGTDHGAHHSQTAVSILLKSSVERRAIGCADWGQITAMLMQMECKKDPVEILALTTEVINKFIRILQTHKVIAIMDSFDEVRCKLVPIRATDYKYVNDTTFQYHLEGRAIFVLLDIGLDPNPEKIVIWDVMGRSTLKKLCDLSAMFSLDGRDGHSSSKCAFCDLTISEMKNGSRLGKLLTTSMLLDAHRKLGPKNSIGAKEAQMWSNDACHNIPPPLHIGIGAINNVRDRQLLLALTKVDCGDEEDKAKVFAEHNTITRKENLQIEKDNLKNDCKRKQEELSLLKKKRAKIDGSVKIRKRTIQSYAPGHKRLEEKMGVLAELERSRLLLQDQISSHTKSIEDMKISISRVETDMKALGTKATVIR